MSILQNINCPICNKPNTWKSENPYKPFCSHRCKLIDLGEWASESRTIPGPIDPNLFDDENKSDE
jgi:endogenous inhibitor of DNA gyrase (YacG/DUF329 family)